MREEKPPDEITQPSILLFTFRLTWVFRVVDVSLCYEQRRLACRYYDQAPGSNERPRSLALFCASCPAFCLVRSRYPAPRAAYLRFGRLRDQERSPRFCSFVPACPPFTPSFEENERRPGSAARKSLCCGQLSRARDCAQGERTGGTHVTNRLDRRRQNDT